MAVECGCETTHLQILSLLEELGPTSASGLETILQQRDLGCSCGPKVLGAPHLCHSGSQLRKCLSQLADEPCNQIRSLSLTLPAGMHTLWLARGMSSSRKGVSGATPAARVAGRTPVRKRRRLLPGVLSSPYKPPKQRVISQHPSPSTPKPMRSISPAVPRNVSPQLSAKVSRAEMLQGEVDRLRHVQETVVDPVSFV